MDKSIHINLMEFSEAVVSDLRGCTCTFSVAQICFMAGIDQVSMSRVLVAERILVQHFHAGLRRSLTVVILDRVSSLSSLITQRTRTPKKD